MRSLASVFAIILTFTVLSSCDDDPAPEAAVPTGWKNSPGFISEEIKDAEFLNDSTVFLLMDGDSMAVSRNSGKNWTYYLNNMQTARWRGWPLDLHVFNENDMVVIGFDGMTQRTRDGGQTWSVFNISQSFSLISLGFEDDNFGWCCESGRSEYHLTYDGGASWERHEIVDENGKTYSGWNDMVHFWPDGRGIMIGDWTDIVDGTSGVIGIFRTEDRGVTWEQEFLDADIEEFAHINIIGSHVWIHELLFTPKFSGSKIWYSSDRAETFELLPWDENREITGMHFVDELHGWISQCPPSELVNSPSVLLYSTSDGGRTWTEQFPEMDEWRNPPSLRSFAAGSNSNAIVYVGGPWGKIYWTDSGGEALR